MKHRQLQRKAEKENKRAKAPSWKKYLKNIFLLVKRTRKRLLGKAWQDKRSMLLEQSNREDRDSGMAPE